MQMPTSNLGDVRDDVIIKTCLVLTSNIEIKVN